MSRVISCINKEVFIPLRCVEYAAYAHLTLCGGDPGSHRGDIALPRVAHRRRLGIAIYVCSELSSTIPQSETRVNQGCLVHQTSYLPPAT